jgi:hypothetical protein
MWHRSVSVVVIARPHGSFTDSVVIVNVLRSISFQDRHDSSFPRTYVRLHTLTVPSVLYDDHIATFSLRRRHMQLQGRLGHLRADRESCTL